MAKSGLKHIDVGAELTKTEWESEDSHELLHGSSFPGSPVERQLFYRDDEHKWYIHNGSSWVWLGGGGGGDMLKSVYDTDDDGIVDNAEKLEGSTKSQVQDHPPQAHTLASHLTKAHDELTGLADDDHPQYIKHSLATAISDFLVASGAGVFVKKTLAEVKTLLDWAADIATHAGLTTGVHSFNKTCRLWNNATQSIPNVTATAVTFNTEKWDTDGMHSLVSNTHLVTIQTAGKYMVVASIEFDPNATGNRQIYIYKNGTELQIYGIDWAPRSDAKTLLSVFCFADLAVNDTIQLKVYQSSGGSLNIATVSYTHLTLPTKRIV